MANPKPNNQNRSQNTETTTSKLIFETKNGFRYFKIKKISLTKGIGPGMYLSRNSFTVGGYDWAIYFYPDGLHPEDNSVYASMFIVLASEVNDDVRAFFKLALVDQTATEEDNVHSHFAIEDGPYTLVCKGCMCGYRHFFRRNVVEASDYLKNGSLLLKGRVKVVKSRMERPNQYKISVPPSNMSEHFKELLMSGNGFDIVFNVGDQKIKAHKLVLAARSPVFRAQFFGLVGNPNMDTVTIEDVEPSVFEVMLLYIYSDAVPDHSSCSMAFMMQHLLAASDRFCLDRLKLICEFKLCDEITGGTVVTSLLLAELHRCEQLKRACLNFAAANLNEVIYSDDYKDLEQGYPSLLSELLQIIAIKR